MYLPSSNVVIYPISQERKTTGGDSDVYSRAFTESRIAQMLLASVDSPCYLIDVKQTSGSISSVSCVMGGYYLEVDLSDLSISTPGTAKNPAIQFQLKVTFNNESTYSTVFGSDVNIQPLGSTPSYEFQGLNVITIDTPTEDGTFINIDGNYTGVRTTTDEETTTTTSTYFLLVASFSDAQTITIPDESYIKFKQRSVENLQWKTY